MDVDAVAERLDGKLLAVTTEIGQDGYTRTRYFASLLTAERHAERARARGAAFKIVVCELLPVGVIR